MRKVTCKLCSHQFCLEKYDDKVEHNAGKITDKDLGILIEYSWMALNQHIHSIMIEVL